MSGRVYCRDCGEDITWRGPQAIRCGSCRDALPGPLDLVRRHPDIPVAVPVRAAPSGFPLAEPVPPPAMITRPCGCTSMTVDDQPVQVSWCDDHDPGYDPAPVLGQGGRPQ